MSGGVWKESRVFPVVGHVKCGVHRCRLIFLLLILQRKYENPGAKSEVQNILLQHQASLLFVLQHASQPYRSDFYLQRYGKDHISLTTWHEPLIFLRLRLSFFLAWFWQQSMLLEMMKAGILESITMLGLMAKLSMLEMC
ncbi:uncharacterized protein LOC117613249 [Prunus dulcis]|uniref:uncharacterized protein LOC117613249 n=1 Tax=Prunus dulcis TaxID=3755 RepID=UPI0014825D93|nr:uncharacterized protein LOC117613249 [Prunus dulcis]